MKMKLLATLGSATVLGLAFLPSAAMASTPWPLTNGTQIGDYWYEVNAGLDSYDTGDPASSFNSMFYDTGWLVFDDGVNTPIDAGSFCADPINAPGTATMDGADHVIMCAPYVIGAGYAGEGLTVTTEYRTIAAEQAFRLFYKVENTTGNEITVANVDLEYQWEYSVNYGLTSSGTRGTGSGLAPSATDHWVVVAEDNTSVPSGVVWSSCKAEIDVDDLGYGAFRAGESLPVTFAAGSSTYYVALTTMEIPTAKTDVAMNAAIDAVADRITNNFGYLTPTLRVGIPDGITIQYWDDQCVPAPTLPDTGLASTQIYALGGFAFVVISLGALVVIRSRRRHI